MSRSPLPVEVIQEQFDFPEAMSRVLQGKKITKLEWDNPEIFISLNNKMLQLHKNGGYYNLLVSEGDLIGTDWVELNK